MNHAIIKIQNKQYIVEPGSVITIDGQHGQVGKTLKLGQILLIKGKKLEIGTPTIKGDVVHTVKSFQKSKKIRVAKFRSKSRYRRVQGHRQMQTTLEITQIGSLKKTSPAKPSPTPKKSTKTKSTKTVKSTKPATPSKTAKTKKPAK